MKYKTKNYQFSNDEPNINNNSTSSRPADEKRLLLKKSYIKQNRKEKRIEKNACEMSTLGDFKAQFEQWPPVGHIIPGLLSGFDPDGKDITEPESLMIVNDPNLHLSLEESSATSVALWGGWEQFRNNAPVPTLEEYVKTYPINTVTRTLGGITYKIKVKQMFDLQKNLVLGFTLITGKWKGFDGKNWGFIKWFEGSWQCQVSETYAFRLGNGDITSMYISQLPRELKPPDDVLQTHGVFSVSSGGAGVGPTGCPKFANEREFLNMYSPVDSDFFISGNRVPGILSGYNHNAASGISEKGFPNRAYFIGSSISLSAKQWMRKDGDNGLTNKQFIKQNPIIHNWSPHLAGEQKFNIKLAQMYSPKPDMPGTADILGFKIMAGIPKEEPNQEYGFIQWYKDSFDCAVSDVYKFKLGYADSSDVYLSMLPPSYRGDTELESEDEESEEEYDENEDVEIEGASALATASSGMGQSSSCPKRCTDPHSDVWWRNTNQILWRNSEHKQEAAQAMKERFEMYADKNTDDIINFIEDTYSIEYALGFSKGLLEDRNMDHVNIKAVYDSYIEMKEDITKKLKLSSKDLLREYWLRKLMKIITNEYFKYHFQPVLDEGENSLENVWPSISNLPYDTQKQAVDAVLKISIEKAEAIFGLLSNHLDYLNIIWHAGKYGSPPLYAVGVLEPFVNSVLDKFKTTILKRYGLDDETRAALAVGEGVGTGAGEGVGNAASGISPGNNNPGPFGGMTFKEEEMLFFKRNAKKIMVAIIKDTPFPLEVLDELEAQAGEGADYSNTQEFNDETNQKLKQIAGDNAPVIDINTSKMSELFHAYSIIQPGNFTQIQDRMNQVMAYIAIHMTGEEEWIVEQFKEIQKSRYKDTKIVKFAVQFIKKLGNTIETEQKIEQKIELDVEQVEKIGEAINETETPDETPPEDIEKAREEVKQECKNAIDRQNAQIEELREDLQKEKDKIKGKDNTIKYGAIGAGVVIVLLILFLLMK